MNKNLQNHLYVALYSLVVTCLNTVAKAQVPSDLMHNCNQWKITYPTGAEDKTLCNEPNNEFFYVSDSGDAIIFYAPIRSDNGTTPNSSNIRSELRERVVDGSADIYWTTEGKHVVYVKQAITHLPINKPHLVATQIHGNKDDGIDDAMVLRLEGNHLFLSFNGGVLRSDITIKTDYVLGTMHEVIFVVNDGKHYCYYSENGNLWNAYTNGNAASYLIKDGNKDYVLDLNYDESYFKIGNYTQSNADKEGADTDNPANYGEVWVYDFFVQHTAGNVSGVALTPKKLDIVAGKTIQISASVIPSNAENQKVSYFSSNSNIVTVSTSGLLTGISAGNAVITVTTDEGEFTDSCVVSVVPEAFGPNLALNKAISGTGTHDGNNVITNLVDGLASTRWSVAGFPQTVTIDLGAVYTVGRTEVITYKDRDYQYTVSISNTEKGTFNELVDRSNNATPGSAESPIIDLFDAVEGRFVKIEITGAETYTGTWLSLSEFRIFGVPSLGVSSFETDNVLQVWPNPASETVYFSNAELVEKIEIYDATGKLVAKIIPESNTIDISKLDAGLYVFKFLGKDKALSKRLVKRY
jgi:hypothetical protein